MLSSDAILERATELKTRGIPFVMATVMRCESPAGVEINAVTPEEIAVSVLAGLIKARREQGADVTGQTRTETIAEQPVPSASISVATTSKETAAIGEAIDPVCGMTANIASANYRSEYPGQSYYFCCTGCQHSFDKAPERYLAGAGASA